MNVDIKLVEFPEKFGIKEESQTEYKLRALMINKKVPVIQEMKNIMKKDKKDFGKLIKNLKMQLGSKEILRNPKKVQIGKNKDQENIIEIKSTRGYSRLFGFFWDEELIICTNTYWKTTSKKGKQNKANKAFNKAVEIRNLFITYNKEE